MPRDVERLARIGLAAYIERQLHPESIDDADMQARVAALRTVRMSTRELADQYFLPALEMRRAAQRTQQTGNSPAMPEQHRSPAAGPPARPDASNLVELSAHKLLRATYSDRQLEEVMVDFWFNHFNVFAGKGVTRRYVTSYERDVIRPHALGRFRTLLGAVAESPAMLFYLDNWQSAAETPAVPARGRRAPALTPPPRERRRGINENYARELLELHTLGVDGGYTQKDVQEVARAFTGWTISTPRQGGAFRFEPRLHDGGEKVVLGVRIPSGGGNGDGDRVLDLLADHPSTARHLARKLTQRFVSDEPPAALIDRAAARFRDTDGDIREVVRLIITSPEFFAADARSATTKTPLEFVASAVRATGVEVRSPLPLVQALRQMGMPPYFCQPPTGYPDNAGAWINTGALLSRMNFALTLATDRRLGGHAVSSLDAEDVIERALGGALAPDTRTTLSKAESMAHRIALVLGSPDFQKR